MPYSVYENHEIREEVQFASDTNDDPAGYQDGEKFVWGAKTLQVNAFTVQAIRSLDIGYHIKFSNEFFFRHYLCF